MATATTVKTEEIVKAQINTASIDRFIYWDPNRDPLAYQLPNGAAPLRPFAFAWLDDEMIALTQPNKQGEVAPSFKNVSLRPGLNRIPSLKWAEAIDASKFMGQSVTMPSPSEDSVSRLKKSARQGVDPIEQQIEARAITVLEFRKDEGAVLNGTLNDYEFSSIRKAIELQNNEQTLVSWLEDVQKASSAHPKRSEIIRLIENRRSELRGV